MGGEGPNRAESCGLGVVYRTSIHPDGRMDDSFSPLIPNPSPPEYRREKGARLIAPTSIHPDGRMDDSFSPLIPNPSPPEYRREKQTQIDSRQHPFIPMDGWMTLSAPHAEPFFPGSTGGKEDP